MVIKKNLPVLQAMLHAVKEKSSLDLQRIVFVCVQHLLYTSLELIGTLIELGANPNNIFLQGKQYSTCKEVAKQALTLNIQLQKLTPLKKIGNYTNVFNRDVKRMWDKVKKYTDNYHPDAIIVLDDGGRCLEFVRKEMFGKIPIIGIEQTTAGLFNPAVINLPIPFIDVATCAAKIYLESDMIVDTIINKLENLLVIQKRELVCGVVGIGVIGKAVAKKLKSLGYKILLYDAKEIKNIAGEDIKLSDSLEQIIQEADYIFGCTGRDITSGLNIEKLITSPKTFISCTSEDKEFLSLLKLIEKQKIGIKLDPLADIYWQLNNRASITILKGGFPINFDKSGESVPADRIQLTRGLLLAALIQAVASYHHLIKADVCGRVMLHPLSQRFIVKEWSLHNSAYRINNKMVKKFDDVDWILQHSGGNFFESIDMVNCFSQAAEVEALTQELEIG